MNRRPAILSALVLTATAAAEDFVLKIREAKETGTSHFSERATISHGSAKLNLTDATFGYSPLGIVPYSLDAKTSLFWGWSSTGGGTEDHHLYVVAARDGKVELIDQLLLTFRRGAIFCSIRWEAPGKYSVFIRSFSAARAICRRKTLSSAVGKTRIFHWRRWFEKSRPRWQLGSS